VIAVVLVVAGAGALLSAQRHRRAPTGDAVDFTSGRPKLLDFGMGICEQCKRMQPVMAQAAWEFGNRLDVHTLDIRDAANDRLGQRFGLRLIPLIILTDAGGQELWRREGFVDFPEISRVVTERLGLIPSGRPTAPVRE
jgi:thiol-disulfide isomerase/thioredoxin